MNIQDEIEVRLGSAKIDVFRVAIQHVRFTVCVVSSRFESMNRHRQYIKQIGREGSLRMSPLRSRWTTDWEDMFPTRTTRLTTCPVPVEFLCLMQVGM